VALGTQRCGCLRKYLRELGFISIPGRPGFLNRWDEAEASGVPQDIRSPKRPKIVAAVSAVEDQQPIRHRVRSTMEGSKFCGASDARIGLVRHRRAGWPVRPFSLKYVKYWQLVGILPLAISI